MCPDRWWAPVTGAWATQGGIRGYWLARLGGPAGTLGYPTSDEYTPATGQRRSNFAHGTITYSFATNAYTVTTT